jgi:hypothetical protein
MATYLYTGEMIGALKAADHPLAEVLEAQYVALNDTVAKVLAITAGANLGMDTQLWDGRLGASFHPVTPEQTLPKILEGWDTDSEWGQ